MNDKKEITKDLRVKLKQLKADASAATSEKEKFESAIESLTSDHAEIIAQLNRDHQAALEERATSEKTKN